jgi:hypothetical protein
MSLAWWGTRLDNSMRTQTQSHSHPHYRTLPQSNSILPVLVLFHRMLHSTLARKEEDNLPTIPGPILPWGNESEQHLAPNMLFFGTSSHDKHNPSPPPYSKVQNPDFEQCRGCCRIFGTSGTRVIACSMHSYSGRRVEFIRAQYKSTFSTYPDFPCRCPRGTTDTPRCLDQCNQDCTCKQSRLSSHCKQANTHHRIEKGAKYWC